MKTASVSTIKVCSICGCKFFVEKESRVETICMACLLEEANKHYERDLTVKVVFFLLLFLITTWAVYEIATVG